MNARTFVTEFVTIALVAFVVALIVTYLYSLLAHGTGVVDWESAVTLGIILGITLPLTRLVKRNV